MVMLLLAAALLTWSPSPSDDVAGYQVYYGTASGVYTTVIDVGPTTSASVGGLRKGRTYWFAVTAYDTSDNESEYSNEVQYTVPRGR
jgi:Fibronectin type III domain